MRAAILTLLPLLLSPSNSISIETGATASEPAVRLGNAVRVQWVAFADVEMPWHDFSSASPDQVSAAVDACIGAIMYHRSVDYRVFAAHNRTCPPEVSFGGVLDVTSVTVDGEQYTLVERWQRPVGSTLTFPDYPAVGLQTSISATEVVLSWFALDS